MIMQKSVAKGNNQLSQTLEPQEVDSLVQTPRRNDGAAGHRLRVYLRKFEELEKEFRSAKIFESAGFKRRVSGGIHHKTIHDVNDGFEGSTRACRECTFSRDDQNLKSNFGSKDTPQLVQFFKSRPHVVLTSTESKLRSLPLQETVQHAGLLHPEAQTATWSSYDTMIRIILQKVMN